MILWIVDTSGWWRQGLWRICHTGCSKCESYQVSKIQTSEMAICKHDARGLPLLTLQWVLLFFIVLAHEVFGSSPLTTFPFLTAIKKGKSKSHIVWHRKWCSRYRDCVLTRFVFGPIIYRLLASGAILWLKEHGCVSSVLTADRVWPNRLWECQVRVHALVRCEHGLDLSRTWTSNHG